VAYFAARWALRHSQVADDEAAEADWENEGGAPSPTGVGWARSRRRPAGGRCSRCTGTVFRRLSVTNRWS